MLIGICRFGKKASRMKGSGVMGSVLVLEADVVATERPAHVIGVAEVAEWKDTPNERVIEAIQPKRNSVGVLLEAG